MYSLGDTKAVVVEKAKQRISKQHSVWLIVCIENDTQCKCNNILKKYN